MKQLKVIIYLIFERPSQANLPSSIKPIIRTIISVSAPKEVEFSSRVLHTPCNSSSPLIDPWIGDLQSTFGNYK